MYDTRISTYTIQFSAEIVHLEEFWHCAATDIEHAGKPAAYLTVSTIKLHVRNTNNTNGTKKWGREGKYY